MKPRASFVVSVARGCVLSGLFIAIFPALFGGSAIWWAIPAAEALVAAGIVRAISSGPST